MVKLDLSLNSLTDTSAAVLSTCLHNIQELNVSYCSLKLNGIECISNEIKHCFKPVIYDNDDTKLLNY